MEKTKKLKEEALERLNSRWVNVMKLMESLNSEFKMMRSQHDRLIRLEYEEEPYDWKKDKSLSVNQKSEAKK